MSIGIILVAIVIYLQLRWAFRRPRAFKYNEPRDVQVKNLKNVILVTSSYCLVNSNNILVSM